MPNALGLLGEARMQATPRNKLMGLLADYMTQANEFATKMDPRYENKRENQTLGLLADAVSLGSLAKTADRMSYGEPLTNAGKANVPMLKPETADALMMAPLSPRNALAMMGAGMGDNGMMKAATVWHGSPHKFDRFDASKIGTGEGAQAYGYGLYLAESPKVAEAYKTALSGLDQLTPEGRAARYMERANGDKQAAMRLAWNDYNAAAESPPMMNAAYGAIEALQRGNVPSPSLYKVDLPDDAIARMLNWDLPLSQQAPEVRKALSALTDADFAAMKPPTARKIKTGVNADGMTVYNAFGGYNDPSGAAQRLRQLGIPGIRYFDGASRGAGQGSSNFVVFPGNEGLLSILERNGQPIR